MWIENDDGSLPPARGFGFVCRSARTGLIHVHIPESRDAEVLVDCAVTTLQEFGLKWDKALEGRPAAIHVSEPWLHERLSSRHEDLDAAIVLVPDLADLTAVLRDLQENQSGDTRPNLLDDVAMSSGRIRAFADAAARFYQAEPWQHLDNLDLVVVEHPKIPKSVTHVSVLGGGGEEFGLGFFASMAEFKRILTPGRPPDRAFGVTFGPIDELPFGDVDLWEDDQLPVAGPLAFPLAAELRAFGEMRRPTATELTVMEGLLRAFAQVTEDELDSGRWSVEVPTFDGPVRFELVLPGVIDALESARDTPSALGDRDRLQSRLATFLADRNFTSLEAANQALQQALAAGQFDPDADEGPKNSAEAARQLAGRAQEAVGRPRVALARRALALDPDCADAWLALVDMAPTDEAGLERARQAVDAGRRAIGEASFAESTGSFWLVYETRPFMRAMAALAQMHQQLGQTEAAIDVWQEMLRLNPNDNQGVRYALFFALLSQRRHDALAALVERYEDDLDITWRYGRAVWTFSHDGATPEAAALLAEAHQQNQHVLPYLIGRTAMPGRLPPSYRLGSRDEAVYGAAVLRPAIDAIDGCRDWIAAQAPVLLRGAKTPARRPASPARTKRPRRSSRRRPR